MLRNGRLKSNFNHGLFIKSLAMNLKIPHKTVTVITEATF